MKVLKNIFSAVLYVLIIAVGVLAAIFLVSGMRLYCVQTGSMEPEYPIGSVILVERVDSGQLSEGDVITYSLSTKAVVTHRVIGIDRENRLLTTKGDNNNTADIAAVRFDDVIGRVIFCVPYVGYAGMVLNTNFGRIMACVVLVGIVGTYLIARMYRKMKDEEDEEEGIGTMKTDGE